jgi:hypothetical protein
MRGAISPPPTACGLNGADSSYEPLGNHLANHKPWVWRPLVADWIQARLRR